MKSSLKLVELVETPDPVQVGHTFNEIFFETLAILSTIDRPYLRIVRICFIYLGNRHFFGIFHFQQNIQIFWRPESPPSFSVE